MMGRFIGGPCDGKTIPPKHMEGDTIEVPRLGPTAVYEFHMRLHNIVLYRFKGLKETEGDGRMSTADQDWRDRMASRTDRDSGREIVNALLELRRAFEQAGVPVPDAIFYDDPRIAENARMSLTRLAHDDLNEHGAGGLMGSIAGISIETRGA